MRPTVVDLFAGCGGLGLGLEQAGFETVFVNELHPDALATYLCNRGDGPVKQRQNHSNDILEVSRRPSELAALAERLRREYGEVALVSGGPPCQGFSGIGHRRTFNLAKEDIPSNHLYREMAAVVQAVAPRAFLFENVRGLLHARWTPGGAMGEVWEDVKKAFDEISVRVNGRILEYRIEHHLVSAKDYGVPQNRPRVLMVGVRSDIDISTIEGSVAGGLLPGPTRIAPPGPRDFLGDLIDPDWVPGLRSTDRYPHPATTPTQRYLRTRPDGSLARKGDSLAEQVYSRHSRIVTTRFEYMIAQRGALPRELRTKKFGQRWLPDVWGPAGPNITATSMPDDYVHFSQPRTPTVREWARIQTFPDWYEFEGQRTTGGRRRAGDPQAGNWARALPKYTQIGNAVPVALAKAIGEHLIAILDF